MANLLDSIWIFHCFRQNTEHNTFLLAWILYFQSVILCLDVLPKNKWSLINLSKVPKTPTWKYQKNGLKISQQLNFDLIILQLSILQSCFTYIIKNKMSFTQRKNQFQVEIRKKNLHSRLTHIRSTLYKQFSHQDNQQIVYQKAKQFMSQLKDNDLVSKIQKIKAFSYEFNKNLIALFEQTINKLCQLVANIDDIKQFSNKFEKDNMYNDILVIFINASCQQSYKWPKQQYLPIIKSILIQSRQINTLWFLANLLYLKNQTSEALCRQLVKYDSINFCSDRLNKKMKSENDIMVLSFYICSFLSNSNYLLFNQYKEIISLVQRLIALNSEEIDELIAESLLDHGSNLKNCNYQILYSKVIKRFGQYCKMKKSRLASKYLQFLKLYISSQIDELIDQKKRIKEVQDKDLQKKTKQNENKDFIQIKKKYKKNYERFASTSLLNVTFCLQTRSPELKCALLQLCYLIVENYFQFIDFQSEIIYLSLAGELQKLMNSPLSKYNDKAIFYQLRYTSVLLIKIISGKGQNQQQFSQVLQSFMKQNKILVILTQILKQKDQRQIINQACSLLYYLVASFNYLKANVQQSILEELILALETSIAKVKSQQLFNKMDSLLKSIKQIQI